MRHDAIVTRERLETELRALGVDAGAVVMLHASVRAVGWVVGGPDEILGVLLDLLGPRGTLMMLASWEDHPYAMDAWPQATRRAYLDALPAFDPATSRADHREMGILAEYLRTRPGAVRSRHPFGYVAVGPHADALLRDHPYQYHHGPDSPLARLCAADGRVLLLGRLFDSVTLLHHAEHLADVPGKRVARYRMPLLVDGARVWTDFEEYDTEEGIVDWPEGDYFDAIVREYVEAGEGRRGRVGHAEAYLFDAGELVRFGRGWMEENLASDAG